MRNLNFLLILGAFLLSISSYGDCLSEAIEAISQRQALTPRELSQNWKDNYSKYKFTGKQVAGKNLLESYSDLPKKAVAKLRAIRKSALDKPVVQTKFNYKNNYTNSNTPMSKVLTQNPIMQRPMLVAVEKLGNGKKWSNYLESTLAEVYRKMAQSRDPKILAMLEDGNISRKVLLDVFKKRFEARGLKISRIAPKRRDNVRSFAEFKRLVKKGPILDDAFTSDLQAHGPYPHLFQLDYVLDDMVKASDGEIPEAQAFFDFWGGSDEGLSVWNDTFDLFDETVKTLRDTKTITERFIRENGVEILK